MQHPDHGYHFAYSDVEVKECQRNGWKVCEPPKKKRVVKKARHDKQ